MRSGRFWKNKDSKGRYLDKVVLQHHSNLTPEEESRRHNLLSENWDAPIVFTTQVQFLETLFGSGTRGARRMHQLANSVIIFDGEDAKRFRSAACTCSTFHCSTWPTVVALRSYSNSHAAAA